MTEHVPLEEGKAAHSIIPARRIPWTVQSVGHKVSDTPERLSHILHLDPNVSVS